MFTPEQQAAWEILKQAFALVSNELRQRWQTSREKAQAAKPKETAKEDTSVQTIGVSESLQVSLKMQLEQTQNAAQLRMITNNLKTELELAVKWNRALGLYREQLPGAPDRVPFQMKIEEAETERDKAIKAIKTIVEKLAQEEVIIEEAK